IQILYAVDGHDEERRAHRAHRDARRCLCCGSSAVSVISVWYIVLTASSCAKQRNKRTAKLRAPECSLILKTVHGASVPPPAREYRDLARHPTVVGRIEDARASVER